MKHVTHNKILNKNQFAFTQNSNTEAAVLQLLHYINKNIESKQICITIFIDFRKAFDMVNRNILVKKLSKINLNTELMKTLESYLTNRKQIVKISDEYSNNELTIAGVPQGGCLSSLFFNIYINSIFKLGLNGMLQCYADDSVITYKKMAYCKRKINV